MGGRVGDSFSDCPVSPGALMHCSIPAEDIVSREDAKARRDEPGLGLVELCYDFLGFFASWRLERSGRETHGLPSTALAIRLVH